MNTYNLFISHSWRYAGQYSRLIDLLRARKYFAFKDHSVPPNDPIHNAKNDGQLRQAIYNHMMGCHVVIILAGVYATYSKWINIEIDLAKNGFAEAKPVIAIKPRGNERISEPVSRAADKIVGWSTESVVTAIRELA